LLRAAYHLGNRHVQLELTPDHLKLEPDHVLGEMLERMHLIVSEEDAAFEPEAGAYALAARASMGTAGMRMEPGPWLRAPMAMARRTT
jgi:urease accessory protein